MVNNFQIFNTFFEGVHIIERNSFLDNRGSFEKLFCCNELEAIWGFKNIHQNNISFNLKAGTIRGFHYQVGKFSEDKLVTCVKGSIYDVIVDVRKTSNTFGKWRAFELSSENKRAILIPEGFAHGFQTLEDEVIVNYCHSAEYNKTFERGVNVFDKCLNVNWPIEDFTISQRDEALPSLDNLDMVRI